ncbi:MAG: hypothetical protein IKO72_01010 [Kiritimatiellae bacterium]|nr:hypothetical protein [Kiritimatiellia bacterium]
MRNVLLLAVAAALAVPAAAFEKIALVDSSDYPHVFDIECRKGTAEILDRVLTTGADTILWRTHSGAMPRYRSGEEDLDRMEWPVDKRRASRSTLVNGWLTLWDAAGEDPLEVVREECASRPQVKRWGFHALLEEAHMQFLYLGSWNLEHPQFWCRRREGIPQMFHASFAYPEVREHRLAIIGELAARNPDIIYLDTFRSGGYWLFHEYVKPNIDAWKRRYGSRPLPKDAEDPLWTEIAGEGVMRYVRGIRKAAEDKGRHAKILLGIDQVCSEKPDRTMRRFGIDWGLLVDEGAVDGIVVQSITVDECDALGSMERHFRAVRERVGTKGKVYFPIMAYNFLQKRPGYEQIAKWAGMSAEDGLRAQLEIAARGGADGIVMECVDPDNYPKEHRRIIREFDAAACLSKKPPAAGADAARKHVVYDVPSKALGGTVKVGVVLPASYGETSWRRYPVVYILHGAGNSHATYAQPFLMEGVDREEFIAVLPDGKGDWWMDSPKLPGVRRETFVVDELVPWIDGRFRTVRHPRRRAVAGHSMGGQGAMRLGMRHPDVFGIVGNVMGGVDICRNTNRGDLIRLLGPYAENERLWKEYSVMAEAERLKPGALDIYTIVGTEDFFLKPNQALHALLSKRNIAHEYTEVRGSTIEMSSHSRQFAYWAMERLLPRFGECFRVPIQR